MISYKLAKQLKEAGFPQPKDGELVNGIPWEEEDSYVPILEELIEWCGSEFDLLLSIGDSWIAHGGQDFKVLGKTPKEVVAKLGLKLHKK